MKKVKGIVDRLLGKLPKDTSAAVDRNVARRAAVKQTRGSEQIVTDRDVPTTRKGSAS